jgi:hypothetical protein
MTDEPTRAEKLHSTLLGYVDGSAPMLDTAANLMEYADAEGYHVESSREKLADVDAHLDRAMEELDSDDHSAAEVCDYIRGARDAARKARQSMPVGAAEVEVPDHTDTGVYDTIGGWLEYVEQYITTMANYADEYTIEQ